MKKIPVMLMVIILTIALLAGCGLTGGKKDSGVIGVMRSGDWVYYVQNGTLYRMKTDWTEKTKLADNFDAQTMIAKQDIIFYLDKDTSIYKMRSDGTGKAKIMDGENIYSFEVSDEWLYYSVKPGTIYKIKTDGTNKTKLFDVNTFKGAMWVSGNTIYYIDGSSLMKMAEGDKDAVKLGDNIEVNGFADDWVYYSEIDTKGDRLNVNRMKPDGSDKEKLWDGEFAAIDGSWLYYHKDDGWLYRSNLEGTGEEKLNNVKTWNLIGVWGDYIYFSEYEGPVYRINLDGSNKMELK